MSQDLLPRTVEARKLALANAEISGELLLEHAPRIEELVYRNESTASDTKAGLSKPIYADLQFSINERSKIEIGIKVSASVNLQCQRCLDPVLVDVAHGNQLTVVAHDDEARSLQKDIDPIILDDGIIDIHSLVEEEVLLALPVVNYHAEADCNAEYIESLKRLNKPVIDDALSDELGKGEVSQEGNKSLGDSLVSGDVPHKENPFEVLKTLKSKLSQE